jgi:S1-C subfamily serine protease
MSKQPIRILLFALVLILGGAVGGLAAFSYLAGLFPFQVGSAESLAPVRITEKQETIIQENKALKDAAAKTSGIAIGIKVTTTGGVSSYGSGLILTSDGLAAAPYSLLPPGAKAQITAGGKKATFEILKRDKAKNLVVIKLADGNWPTASFYQMDNLKLGERLFLEGMTSDGRNFVNEGIVRDFSADSIATSIWEKNEALGSPVFDIEGNIMGIATLDKNGMVGVIPIAKIKTFSGL